MTNFSKPFRPALLLLVLIPSFLPAEQSGSAPFEALTAKWYGVARTEVPNTKVEVAFSPDGSAVVFELEAPAGRRLCRIDPASGERGPSVDPGTGWKTFQVENGGALLLQTRGGWKRWENGKLKPCDPPAGTAKEEKPSRRGRQGWESPDGNHELESKDGQLLLVTDGKPKVMASKEAGYVFRDAPIWTADSSRFAIWRTRDVEEWRVHYVDSTPDDRLQPKHFTRAYPKAGDDLDTRAPWVGFVDGRGMLKPDLSLIKNPFQCRNLQWRNDGHRLTYEFIERGFGKHRIIEMDSDSGQQRMVVNEESDTYIYVFGGSFRHDLDDGKQVIWMSERDGWRHLYLFDGRDGSVIRQLTQGKWVVREVVTVDEENRELLVTVGGIHSDQDPYFIHYARVGLDDGKVTPLTVSPGTHDRFERSPDGEHFTCRWSRVDHAPVTELRRWRDGALISVLAAADASQLEGKGWRLPERFSAKDRDWRFDIHGIIVRPPDFDPSKRYPVIEKIYAGPHGAFVPKSWRPWRVPMHEVAAHGFIVVQIDGKGTNHRSREFSHFAYKNLKDSGLPDRIAWMKAAAAKYPEMDLERVGIFGGSAGGQSALAAVLFHADFYKAAAADCGCHDNRMDKIWWNEQWMDWPVGPHYADNSNATHVDKLKGALFLTVGELDTNVDPSSTYQVVDALIKADKDFDYLMVPGGGHGVGESRYAQRRRVDFFRRHLGGPESVDQ